MVAIFSTFRKLRYRFLQTNLYFIYVLLKIINLELYRTDAKDFIRRIVQRNMRYFYKFQFRSTIVSNLWQNKIFIDTIVYVGVYQPY